MYFTESAEHANLVKIEQREMRMCRIDPYLHPFPEPDEDAGKDKRKPEDPEPSVYSDHPDSR